MQSRYLTCEGGNVKLEECPEGLHYIHRNRTCEWPTGGQCSDPFGRSSFESDPPSSLNDKPNNLPVLTSTRSKSENYPAKTTPLYASTYRDLQEETSNAPQITIEEVNPYQTTERKLSTEYFDSNSISTLDDLLAFLNSTADYDYYPESLNTLGVDPLDPTTPRYVIINKEDRDKQRTSSRYPTTLFEDGQYQTSSDGITNTRRIVQQTTEPQGYSTSETYQDSEGRGFPRNPNVENSDDKILFQNREIPTIVQPGRSNNGQNAQTGGGTFFTTNNILVETQPISTERELLSTAEDNYSPTVWTQSTTQKSLRRTLPEFTIPVRTSGSGRVRFPTTTEFEEGTRYPNTQQAPYEATLTNSDRDQPYDTTLVINSRTPET